MSTSASPTTTYTVYPIPIALLFGAPQISQLQISPDGRWLAMLKPTSGPDGQHRLNLFVRPIQHASDPTRDQQVSFSETQDVQRYAWKGNRVLLYCTDSDGDEHHHWTAVDIHRLSVTPLTPRDRVSALLIHTLDDDPRHVLMAMNLRDVHWYDLYRVHIDTGLAEMWASNPGLAGEHWVSDNSGQQLLVKVVRGDGTSAWLYRPQRQANWRCVRQFAEHEDELHIAHLGPQGRIWGTCNLGRDKLALVRGQVEATGLRLRWVREDPEYDIDLPMGATDSASGQLKISQRTGELLCLEYLRDKPVQVYGNRALSIMHQLLQDRHPGAVWTMANHSKNECLFVVKVHGDRQPGLWYLFDSRVCTITLLGQERPGLDANSLLRSRPIVYTARDGLRIHGYFTAPHPAQQGRACVLKVHGGPWLRDGWGFQPEDQFLASRGYGVLRINFRGSTGYGRAFLKASYKQWGLAMQDDITDGAQWLLEQGFAQPGMLGIYGASYGGYAALAAATLTPDLFAAAVDYVGISDLTTLLDQAPAHWQAVQTMLRMRIGDPVEDAEHLRRVSPGLHAERIRTPLLVVHGARDPRVHQVQSDQIVQRLRLRGVPVEYLLKEDEGHKFRKEENILHFYRVMETFLAQHLQPTAPAKPVSMEALNPSCTQP